MKDYIWTWDVVYKYVCFKTGI